MMLRESIKRRQTRARRIAAALQKLDTDSRCSATAMRLALAPDEWEGYSRRAWLCIPVLTGDDATEFRRYKACLTRADCLRDRAMKLPTVGWQALKQDRLARMAQREYGDAWEILEQLLRYQNPVVEMLLDRPFEGSSSEPEDIPRPWNSQHEFALGDASARLREYVELQRATLRDSLNCVEMLKIASVGPGSSQASVQRSAGAPTNAFADFDLCPGSAAEPFDNDAGLLPQRFRGVFGPLL
jgi:hypothetical protein